MKHTDSIVISCPEDPDHFMLNAIEPDQIVFLSYCNVIRSCPIH